MKKVMIAMVCMMGLVLTVNVAGAALVIGDGDYVGKIVDGIPPSNELTYINNLIMLEPGALAQTIGTESYDRVGSSLTNLPTLTGVFVFKDEDEIAPFNSWTVTLKGPFYILGKYDQSQAGSLVWFIDDANIDDVITIPSSFNGHNISHLSVYSNVPLPASLILFGSGLVGLAGISRRKRRA